MHSAPGPGHDCSSWRAVWQVRSSDGTQASLEEFAGLDATQQAALLEPWRLPSTTALDDASAASDLPVTGPAGKRHKA